jgi:hypothetical protein
MSTDPGNRAYSDLVGGLLDARDDPATARFDAELATAVERGDVSDDTARRLKFWQRASLRALTDHTRTVLPTALGALEASRREARENAATDAELLDQEVEEAAEPDPGSDLAAAGDEPEAPPETPAAPPAEVDLRDTPGTASTSPAPGASSLGGRAHRMIIAGLVPALPVRPEQF